MPLTTVRSHLLQNTCLLFIKANVFLDHIAMFKFDPETQDSALWQKLKKEYAKNGGSILELIDKHYGLTIAPAFSDHINDNQPPWTDVTFFQNVFRPPG